YLNPKEIEYIK
ncbi:hypothetical protein FOXB_01664, partial [Fusarium oxysporum f. sp. conglutinans Fo5176]